MIKRTLPALSLALLLLSSVSLARAQEGLTKAEEDAVAFCDSNITAKTYSPDKASKCLDLLHNDNDRLIEKLKTVDNDELVKLLKYQNAFKELGDFYDSELNWCRVRKMLIRTLEGPCPICTLQPPLGPSPTKLLPWVNTHAAKSEELTKKAGLEWDQLTDLQVELSSYSYTAADWNEMTLQQRMATLAAIDIIDGTAPGFFAFDKQYCGSIRFGQEDFLRYFLDPGMQARYAAYKQKLADLGAAGAASAKNMEAKAGQVSNMNAGLNGKGDQFSYLGRTFDGSNISGTGPGVGVGGTPAPPSAYTLTDDQARQLSARLQTSMVGQPGKDGKYPGGELKGTKTGDGLLTFFNARDEKGQPVNKMDFAIKKMDDPHTGADYCPTRCAGTCGGCTVGQIRLNQTMVEEWMKAKGVTAEELMKDDALVDRLGRHVAPTFVHEATHQTQDRWAQDNKIPDKYHLDQEVQTFGAQARFLKEKLSDPKTEGLYMQDMRKFDEDVMSKVEEGGYSNLKKFIRHYNLHGVEGTSADKFTNFEQMLKESNLRKTDPARVEPADDSRCWEGNPAGCSSAKLQQMIDSTYPWYQRSVAEQKKNIDILNTEMAALNKVDKSKRYKTILANKPEELP